MIIVPVITGSIKVDASNNTMKIFDTEFTYTRNDQEIVITDKDNSTTIDDKDAVYALNKVFDYLEKNDLTEITALLEITFVFVIVLIVLTFMILGKVRKLFNSIHDGDTPFTMENVEYIRKIALLLIITAAVKIFGGVATSLFVSNNSSFSFSLTDVMYILILYAAAYIFEYGCSLQAKSDKKIYER